MASRLLPEAIRDRAVVVYAWCRRADDAVDRASPGGQRAALERLRGELDDIYRGRDITDPTLVAFKDTVEKHRIPHRYPDDLLAGMEMDVTGTHYNSMEVLLRYCYCVAGTVGLMMCHVMGVADERATRNAVHLGIAMQLTNICRDVFEDWQRGRLYIPSPILEDCGCNDLAAMLGGPFPDWAREPVARATRLLLDEAERYYTSGDAGLSALSWRCALAVNSARRVYSAIGDRVREAGCDPLVGRAIVPTSRKLGLVAASLVASVTDAPGRLGASSSPVSIPEHPVNFPGDVLPL